MNIKKPKTLVCILGQTRAQNITWKSFNKFVLKSLNADLALCVAEKETQNNFMYKNAKYIWKYKDSKDYSEKFDNAQKTLIKKYKIKNKLKWRKLIKIKHFWLARIKGTKKIRNYKGNFSSGTGALLIYNRWFLLQKILKLNIFDKYERVIVTRSDFVWNIHHPKLENLDENYIWIPNGEKYGGYTDRHAVLSKSNYYDYLNLLEPILLEPDKLFKKMIHKNNWNLERYIKFHLHEKGFKNRIKFFPYLMYSVRDDKIKTTFRPGSYSNKHKYYIKYFKEYLSSMTMLFLIGNKNNNYNKYKTLYLLYRLFKNLFKLSLFLKIFLRNKKILRYYDVEFVNNNLKKKFII